MRLWAALAPSRRGEKRGPRGTERLAELVLRGAEALGGGTGLRLTFEVVREDSRYPVGVTCVWAG